MLFLYESQLVLLATHVASYILHFLAYLHDIVFAWQLLIAYFTHIEITAAVCVYT
jgi:hypothetical protein